MTVIPLGVATAAHENGEVAFSSLGATTAAYEKGTVPTGHLFRGDNCIAQGKRVAVISLGRGSNCRTGERVVTTTHQ